MNVLSTHRTKRGMTLIEIVVVIAIIGIMAALSAPSLNGILGLQQQSAVKELGQTYIWLQEEASLRNVCFRLSFNLDRGTWKIEMGDPSTLVFSSTEEAEEHQDDLKSKMRRFTKRQIEEGAMEEETKSDFQKLDDPAFKSEHTLPEGLSFAYVYTPQYGEEGKRPSDREPDEPEDESIAYSHIFPDGTVEHTVIRVVDGVGEDADFDDGYTLEIEPINGRVQLTDEIIDPTDSMDWLPEEGPELR